MTVRQVPDTGGPAAAALAEAAVAAGSAPSIHNTQPWQWQVHPDRLELYAQRSRQLAAVDPDGRMLTVSCGAALHQARLAFAAQGWRVAVSRLPDPANPDLLARITLTGRGPVRPEAVRLYQSAEVRHSDRRPVTRASVPPPVLAELARVAADEGARLQVLRPEQVDELAVAVARAAEVDSADPAVQAELDRWTGGSRAEGAGLPDEVIPQERPKTNVPGRDFARTGTLRVGGEHDRTATYALLYGTADDPPGWLAGGEALSAVWLAAVRHGLGVLPISEPVEMPATRQALRRVLSFLGWPYLALRIGIPDPDQPGPPHTPRLPADQTVTITHGS